MIEWREQECFKGEDMSKMTARPRVWSFDDWVYIIVLSPPLSKYIGASLHASAKDAMMFLEYILQAVYGQSYIEYRTMYSLSISTSLRDYPVYLVIQYQYSSTWSSLDDLNKLYLYSTRTGSSRRLKKTA